MPDRVSAEDIQTSVRETVMIIDYNKSNNITEEERLASFRESVQRALDEQTAQLAQIEKSNGQELTQKVAVAEKRAAFAKQKTESLDQDVVYMQERMDSGEFKGEDAILLRVDSSRGTAFKNSEVNTVLSAVIFLGGERIETIEALHNAVSPSAYLQWKWQAYDSDVWHTIVSTDSRIGQGGFTLTLTPEDVDIKAVFSCELID